MTKIIQTSGKKKTAIARAVLKPGNGRIRINNIPLEIYTPELARLKITEPIMIAGEKVLSKVDIEVKVSGGGTMGQAGAVRTAIARGIVEWASPKKSIEIKEKFAEFDRYILVNDPRRKESKKFGGRRARSRFQKSYR